MYNYTYYIAITLKDGWVYVLPIVLHTADTGYIIIMYRKYISGACDCSIKVLILKKLP